MFICIFAIVLFAAVFTAFNFRNKFINVIMLCFCSICMMMFACVLYVSKFLNYTELGDFDLSLYIWLSKIKISINQINLIYNTAFVLFIFAGLYFISLIRNMDKRKWLPLFTAVAAFYMYTNSKSFIWILYSKVNYLSPSAGLYRGLAFITDILNTGIISLSFLLPFIYLFIYYINTKIYTKRKNAITYAICLGSIDIYILSMLVMGIFPSIPCKNLSSIGVPSLNLKDSIPMHITLFSVSIIVFIVLIIMSFKPFNMYVLVQRREMARNSVRINKNIRMTLHMHKNAFIGIEKKTELARAMMESGEIKLVENQLDDINRLANEYIHRIERMLNVLRDPNMYFEIIELNKCISDAVSNVSIPSNIKLSVSDIPETVSLYASTEHITEVFVNIIINSIEAITAKNSGMEGKIDITVIDEDDIVAINFTDNGCGIPKSSYKDIYKPFFSTKTISNCGGIGLDYVKRIVKSHHGDIYVKSNVGVYTMFQIVLPAIKKEQNNG